MLLYPCSLSDRSDAKQIMFDYTNYAPEDMNQTSAMNDREYIHSLFDSEASSEMTFIGRDAEHRPQVFLFCSLRKVREGLTLLYVTNLFVKNSSQSGTYAAEAVRQLSSHFSDRYRVCVNVLASAGKTIEFGQKQGGKICPEFSVFTNTSNESIQAIAYPTL